jgi:hypothetical protein
VRKLHATVFVLCVAAALLNVECFVAAAWLRDPAMAAGMVALFVWNVACARKMRALERKAAAIEAVTK